MSDNCHQALIVGENKAHSFKSSCEKTFEVPHTDAAGKHHDDVASGIFKALHGRAQHRLGCAERECGGDLHGHAVGGRGLDHAGHTGQAKQVGGACAEKEIEREIEGPDNDRWQSHNQAVVKSAVERHCFSAYFREKKAYLC